MNFLSIWETTPAGLVELLKSAADVKKNRAKYSNALAGSNLVMLFERSSTRTRISFDIAASQLGMHSVSLDFAESQLSRGESIADTAKVLGRYADCIMARLYKQEDIISLAQHSGKPTINGLTDVEHPCQALGDLLTMQEKGKLEKGKTFCFIGDASRNMANSLMLAAAKAGMDVVLVCPKKIKPQDKYVAEAKKHSKVSVVNDAVKGISGADVVYTDLWVDPGHEGDTASKISQFEGFQLNQALLSHAKKDCIVMHCLPAHRGLEITSDVMDGKNSAIWDQAENRLHVQKAILLKLLEKA